MFNLQISPDVTHCVAPEDQRPPPSNSCWRLSFLIWKSHISADVQKRKVDKVMEKNPLRFTNPRDTSFQVGNARPEVSGSRQSTEHSSLNILTLLCPFLATVRNGTAGWMEVWLCSPQMFFSSLSLKGKNSQRSYPSVFQMGKAFNCFQPGARAVPVTMKWKAPHPALTSHGSLVLSSFPCLAFAFLNPLMKHKYPEGRHARGDREMSFWSLLLKEDLEHFNKVD